MATPLPPFGIRNLVSSEEAYNVLQVDEEQYNSTIRSHPSATLMYVDEDDGENVTIGSSLELKQRLEDPPPATAPLIHFYNPSNEQLELQFIHLFDIQRSNASQSVWREQHAYFTKGQQGIELAQNNDRGKDAAREPTEDRLGSSLSTHIRDVQEISQRQLQETRENYQSNSRPVTVLSSPVPDLIENLTKLLDTTSETLKKVTEKTRESNTSPIEDVLFGVSNIVAEIGNFGMSLLESIENRRADQSPSANQETVSPSVELVPESQISVGGTERRESISAADVDTTLMPEAPQTSAANVDKGDIPTAARDGCDFCWTMKLQCRKSPNSTMACTNCVTLGRPCVDMPISDANGLDKESERQAPEGASTVPRIVDSILDQETEDVDFSRRYPPLMSLRRANTVAGLRGHATEPEVFKPNAPSLEKHNSCKVRFLRRPFPQVFDAETQRRKDFARQCFPTQRYTPGLGAQKGKPISPPQWKFRRPLTAAEPCRTDRTSTDGRKLGTDMTSTEHALSSKALGPTELVDSGPLDAEASEQTIPGAWPKLKGVPPVPQQPSSESSGAFFERMMREGSTSRQNVHGMKSIARHASLIRQKPNTNPFHNLTRSNTVGGPPNPASRLNGPFEPLYPTSQASNSANAPDNSGHLQASSQSSNRDTVTHQKVPSERLRPFHPYRPFSPVWEDNLDHKRAKFTPTTAAYLDHRGESSSMYSPPLPPPPPPPPRHMQSVPNFATFTANLNSSKSTLSIRSELSPPTPPQKTTEPPATLFSGTAPVPEPRPSIPDVRTRDAAPFEPFQLSRTVSPEPLVVPTRPEHPLNKTLDTCFSALQAMGYGCDDENLKSRLHIYAEAANGDVMEAVEMIEEDKKAHSDISVEGQLRERNDEMDWESD